MPEVEFFIPIIPRAQKRDRIAVVGGHARSYKHKAQRVEENNLRVLIYRELPLNHLWPLKTPIKLWLAVALPIPQSTSKKQRQAMLEGEIRHVKKPDLDNLEKHLMDCCTGVLWEDDRQIDDKRSRKYYSDEPGWHIRLEW